MRLRQPNSILRASYFLLLCKVDLLCPLFRRRLAPLPPLRLALVFLDNHLFEVARPQSANWHYFFWAFVLFPSNQYQCLFLLLVKEFLLSDLRK